MNATAEPAPPPPAAVWRRTRRLATDGIRRSADSADGKRVRVERIGRRRSSLRIVVRCDRGSFGDHRWVRPPRTRWLSPPTDTVRSSVPRTILTSNGIGLMAMISWSWSASVTAVPAISTIRSPSRIPARAAGLPSSTPRTRTPSRSGSPTDRRRWRATRAGATAIPSRGRSTDSPRAECLDSLSECAVRRKREVEALAEPVRVQSDQAAVGVEKGPAG